TVDDLVLRLCATPLCYAFVLRLCATPLCYAFVLRLRATPLCYAFSIAPSIYYAPTHSPARCTPATPRAWHRGSARRCGRPAPRAPPCPFRGSPAPRAGPAAGRRCGNDAARGTTCARCSC